jgi:hypothetical protein
VLVFVKDYLVGVVHAVFRSEGDVVTIRRRLEVSSHVVLCLSQVLGLERIERTVALEEEDRRRDWSFDLGLGEEKRDYVTKLLEADSEFS